ncbi:alpha/beta fold hydrolase [Nocardia tengchongensis]|uniref:alpha/beta fold hydrolase n=1 Tax=Nocardia tengchongensis TaxID=2055889 RepID=UPI003694C3F3
MVWPRRVSQRRAVRGSLSAFWKSRRGDVDRYHVPQGSRRWLSQQPTPRICQGRNAVQVRPVGPGRSSIHVQHWGDTGPRVILVHGVRTASLTWSEQEPLSQRMRVEVVVLPEHRSGGQFRGGDYLRDADDLMDLLADEPAHLVGTDYGALSCLVAAGRRPHRVESLTLIEPTCIGVLRHPAIVDMCSRWWRERPQDLVEFAAGFARFSGLPTEMAFTAEHWAAIERLREYRPPWDAQLPLDTIAQWGIPTQVYSGGHSPVLTAVAETVAASTGGEHVELFGREHAVQTLGAPFNERLGRHIDAATRM